MKITKKTCESCVFYDREPDEDYVYQFGKCQKTFVPERWDRVILDTHEEFYVGKDFCCLHWTKKG